MNPFSKLVLQPGAVDSINAQGSNFWVVYAAVPIQVMYPGGEFATFEQGTGLDNLPDSGTFQRLTVRNPSLGVITVVVYVGGPLFRDSRMAIMEARTRLSGWAGNSLAAGISHAFDGLTPAGGAVAGYIDLKRHSIVIANLDPASPLQILDAAGTVCGVVFAQTEMILPVSEPITVKNGTGVAISCYIAEIWSAAPY